jgi:hypothetical protein
MLKGNFLIINTSKGKGEHDNHSLSNITAMCADALLSMQTISANVVVGSIAVRAKNTYLTP